ncbi:MAG: Tyrosine--tRNA ligase cytoplasmic [Claussenomyces sp. TS43310]|nr:MAG: Tyrosine--tRNA ligase cytoplasmic [Claussenomyces sp. TS43310]
MDPYVAAALIMSNLGEALGGDIINNLDFILSSSIQLSREYTMDRFKLEGVTDISAAQKAGPKVVKQTDDPTLGGLIYPLMQALDEVYRS